MTCVSENQCSASYQRPGDPKEHRIFGIGEARAEQAIRLSLEQHAETFPSSCIAAPNELELAEQASILEAGGKKPPRPAR